MALLVLQTLQGPDLCAARDRLLEARVNLHMSRYGYSVVQFLEGTRSAHPASAGA